MIMKRNIYIQALLFLLIVLSSCDKETEGVSRTTYYTDLQLLGNATMTLAVGETYVDPGYVAIENEEDVSENVKVSGTVDTSKPGAYTISYNVANVDGFLKSAKRLVLVAPANVSTLDVSGSYSGQREGQPASNNACTITNLGKGVFFATDFFGGFYNIVRGYGPSYSLATYFYLNSDNTYVSLSNNSPWGPWGFQDGVYNPATTVFKHRVSQGTTAFNVSIFK